MSRYTPPRVDVHLDGSSLRSALCKDAMEGLCRQPKELSPKWFYDAKGSELFDQITRLPEYYPTRRERAILESKGADIAEKARAEIMIELGSGSSDKTRLLLEAMVQTGRLRAFVPFDVSESALRASAASIAADFPGLTVNAIVGDFDHHLGAIPDGGRRLVAFLGGTIGNYCPAPRAALLGQISSNLEPGDSLLLGTDLVKDPRTLEAAYDDSDGVTAEFNLNLLRVLNRELAADFDLGNFEHVARFDGENEWIEMLLRSTEEQRVSLEGIGLEVGFERGEEMRTEISAKFRRDRVESELAAAGLELQDWWTDAAGDFAVSLSYVR